MEYAQLKRKLLKDKKVRAEYEALGPEFLLIKSIIQKRLQKKWTQHDLARRIGTKQSAIARLESGRYNPSIAFLKKVAWALNTRLQIEIR